MTQTPGDARTPSDDASAEANHDLDAAVARSRTIGRDGSVGDTREYGDVRDAFRDRGEGSSVEPSHEEFGPAPATTDDASEAPAPAAEHEHASAEPVAAETAEPVTAETVADESMTAESADAEPATVEPVTVEPATAEPATAEPVTVETADAEPASSATTEHAVAEPAPAESASETEATRSDEAPDADTDTETEGRASRTIEVDRTRGDDATAFAPLGVRAEEGELPARPRKRSNRALAFTLALIGTLAFGALFLAAFAALRLVYTENTDFVASVLAFLPTAAFYVPVIAVGLFFILWALLSNRGGHWSYIVASTIAAGIGYVGYHVGVAMQLTFNTGGLTIVDPLSTVLDQTHLPAGLLTALLAALTVMWFGGMIGSRGRRLRAQHRDEVRRYDEAVRAAESGGVERAGVER